ncbi:Sec-independent protein translocase protein TatB [Candidatus Pantoea carbekii]|uniref:Sec-independent protein translocase protein TatB n=1 Tax=Candidatus Pantoea carbekii TaxID=1235990 RepID=UPI00061876BE|nr:Sec-independent protein translocase protein TatB [Candidatus Pantoea carbekii]AKC32261.1 sec-independent protein translocase [Candidatus Pantoea carbekii]
MFNICFSELVLVCIIGLVVLGPHRLPIAIKTIMSWIRSIHLLTTNIEYYLTTEFSVQERKNTIKKLEEISENTLSMDLRKSMEELTKNINLIKNIIQKNINFSALTVKNEQYINTLHQELLMQLHFLNLKDSAFTKYNDTSKIPVKLFNKKNTIDNIKKTNIDEINTNIISHNTPNNFYST